MNSLQPRQQRIVSRLLQCLEGKDSKALEQLRARARSLPAMLQRHGLIQVLLFLEASGKAKETSNDDELARCLRCGIEEVLGSDKKSAKDAPSQLVDHLAKQNLFEIMIYQEVALETAVWTKRLIEARTEPAAGAAQDDAS